MPSVWGLASNICPQQRAKNNEKARKTAISGDDAWAWFCHLIATGWARYAIPFWDTVLYRISLKKISLFIILHIIILEIIILI